MKSQFKVFSYFNFAEDPQKYGELELFWTSAVKEITGADHVEYIQNSYANGTKILDGNPIFSSLLADKKALRIIQLEKDPEEPVFASWLDHVVISDKKYEELVISLQLSPETFYEFKSLLTIFNTDALSKEWLKAVNEKFTMMSNLTRLNQTIKSVDSIRCVNRFSTWKSSEGYFKKPHLDAINKFLKSYLVEQDELHMISLVGRSPLHNTYNKFLKNMDCIYQMTNIGITDEDIIKSPQKFEEIVSVNFGSFGQYVIELQKSSILAGKQYEELKGKLQNYSLEV